MATTFSSMFKTLRKNAVSQKMRFRLPIYLAIAAVLGLGTGLGLQGFALATSGAAYFQDSRQVTLLFIGVDTLDEEADLEGAWLATYLPGDPDIHFAPIYPAGVGFTARQMRDLAGSFKITENKAPGLAFFRQLNRMGIAYWDAYLVLDGLAVSNLLGTFKQVEYAGKTYLPAATLMSDVPRAAKDPAGAYQFQAFMIGKLCQGMLGGTHDIEFVRVAQALNHKNMYTSVGLDDLVQFYYQTIRWEKGARCLVGPEGE